MNKGMMMSLALLASLPGCGGDRNKSAMTCSGKSCATGGGGVRYYESDGKEIYVAENEEPDESIRGFFDAEGEFVAQDDDRDTDMREMADATDNEQVTFSAEPSGDFPAVYFDFGKAALKPEQAKVLAQDINEVKKCLESCESGEKIVVVLEGHADDAAGTREFNDELSRKRAKVVCDQFVAAGIPQELVKVVGRGSSCPAIVAGKKVTGSREEQWANRRVEVHLVNA